METILEEIEEISEHEGGLTGLSSGFVDLDEKTSGFQPEDYILLAARPSMGKTAFALNVVAHLGAEKNIPVAIFSLEMSEKALVTRMLCSHARIDSHRVRRGYESAEELRKLHQVAAELEKAPIYIDDTAGISVPEVRARAIRLARERDIKFFVLDYLQLMGPSGARRENRNQEVTEMSRSIKALARETGVPFMVLSQLNRSPETRKKHRPRSADLRESGSLEQDADLVLLLYRPEFYDQKKPELKGRAELIIAKQRNGPTGTVNLVFRKEYTRFENCSAKEDVA